ncbi:hypothetical protein NA78x_005642 [Anatilimnocola sp. NA78]|uniref:hypothetical protein n=1 Tax=Anatilimnocola sp. NA78 TaxID=3415683 RepID=UPI003CE50925
MFDANIGKPMIDELARILESQSAQEHELAEVVHVFDFQASLGMGEEGVWDEHWIKQAGEQGYTVIASDRGKGGVSKGKKLPRLCEEYGITHVLLGESIHRRRKFSKLLSILSVWHELVDIAREEPGKRYFMEAAGSQESQRGKAKVTHRPITKRPPLKPFPPSSNADVA